MIGWFGVPYQTLRRATSQPAGCFEEFGSGPVGTSCVADRCALLLGESDHQRFGAALVVGDGWSSGAGHDPTIAQYRNFGKPVDVATWAQYIKSCQQDTPKEPKMNATTISQHTGHVVGRCSSCKTVIVHDSRWNTENTTCTCGTRVRLQGIYGRETQRQCGPKCTSAVGPVCDCTCGGKNHAIDHR